MLAKLIIEKGAFGEQNLSRDISDLHIGGKMYGNGIATIKHLRSDNPHDDLLTGKLSSVWHGPGEVVRRGLNQGRRFGAIPGNHDRWCGRPWILIAPAYYTFLFRKHFGVTTWGPNPILSTIFPIEPFGKHVKGLSHCGHKSYAIEQKVQTDDFEDSTFRSVVKA